MTRKDYELIAALLRNPPIDAEHRRFVAEHLANQFAADNPLFDRGRFLAAALP